MRANCLGKGRLGRNLQRGEIIGDWVKKGGGPLEKRGRGNRRGDKIHGLVNLPVEAKVGSRSR